jgi:hypothetical protein
MADHQKHGATGAWAAGILVVILVGYPVSLGPSCWVSSRTGVGTSVVDVAYRPMLLAADRGPTSIWRCVQWYSKVGAPSGWVWSEKGWHYDPFWEISWPDFPPELPNDGTSP